jgi:hypothetical protein
MYGGAGPGRYLNYLDQRVTALLIRWALLGLVEAYQGALSRSRDLFPGLQVSRRGATRLLDFIGEALSVTGSLASIRSDLEAFADSPWWLREFPPFSSIHDSNRAILTEELRLKQGLARISRNEEILEQHLTQYASVFSASASLRLQAHVRVLTWIMLFLTLISVALGFIAVRDQLVVQHRPTKLQQAQPCTSPR